jgi:hypothetical protein
MLYGKVVGGDYMNAAIDTNRKGELALSLGFKRFPSLTVDSVAAWEEIPEARGGAAGAVSKVGQAVARAALPGTAGKAASAVIDSTVETVTGRRTIRVDWVDGKQSLVRLPDKFFQHLAIFLADRRIATATAIAQPAAPTPAAPPGLIGQIAQLAGMTPAAQPDVTEQIAKLAALRDQGALTEDEFATKKAELLGRL